MEISLRELKQWRLWAQYLTEKTTPLQAAGDLCGIQAQYAANAIHALAIRCENTDTTGLLKSWTLRGTLHLFPEKDLPLYLPEGRCDFFDTPYGQWRYGHGCAVSRERMGFFAQVVESALSAEPVTRDRLKALCRERGMTAEEEPWVFDGWGGVIRMLAEGGHLCLSAAENRAYIRCPAFSPMPTEQARPELLRRYLTHYGPVSLHDMMYFFRWTQRELKGLLPQLSPKTLTCGGQTYYYLKEPEVLPTLPRCIFLAGFDPLMLGYEKKESPFLPAGHLKKVFNNTGIVFPTLLVNGTVQGKWKEQDKYIALTAFENWNKTQTAAIQKAAKNLWPDKPLKF
ncbi:MAG: winged helix DNA-binding domain-containing protein [Clostridia bacterium]|nr:winged helix DNA-binding domain-containing protein [Clostridia bacterium]